MFIEKNYSCSSSMDPLIVRGKHSKIRSRPTSPIKIPFLLKPLIRPLFYNSLNFTITISFSLQIIFALRFTISVQQTGCDDGILLHITLSIMLAVVMAQSVAMFATHVEQACIKHIIAIDFRKTNFKDDINNVYFKSLFCNIYQV